MHSFRGATITSVINIGEGGRNGSITPPPPVKIWPKFIGSRVIARAIARMVSIGKTLICTLVRVAARGIAGTCYLSIKYILGTWGHSARPFT